MPALPFDWTPERDAALLHGLLRERLTFKEAGKLAGATKEQAGARIARLRAIAPERFQ